MSAGAPIGRRLLIGLLSLPILSASVQAQLLPSSEERIGDPLWEVGFGGGIGWLPDYPAAGQNHVRGLALPFVIYRGEFLQIGERGLIRGLFVETERVEFDISLAGSFPVDSDDNDARDGLDDLDYLGEIGPRMSYFFRRDPAGNELRLDLALRAVLSTDFSEFDYVGLVVHPQLVSQMVDVGGIKDLELDTWLGLRIADEGVMDLFYEVPAAFANDQRAAFDAEAGYLGANLGARLSYQVTERLQLSLDGGLGLFTGSANEDSPLFIDEVNLAIGSTFVWTLYESERRVSHPTIHPSRVVAP